MQTRKISINDFIIPRNKNIVNEQALFKDKLHKGKNINIEQPNDLKEKIFFFKENEIQNNSITEEDDYNFEIYNNPIEKSQYFLFDFEKNDEFKTMPIYSHLKGLNSNILKISNNKKNKYKSYSQNFYTTSIEINNDLNLTITDEEKISDKNINYSMNNINMFRKLHKEKKKLKLLNNMISKENKNENNKIGMKNTKYIILNKFSKKYRKNIIQKIDNGIILKHSKVSSQPINGPYLRKNRINSIKNFDKYLSNNISKYDLNDIENQYKIKPETKNLFSRYSQIDTNINDKKLNITNINNTKVNNLKNKKIKIITSTLYDLKKNIYKQKSNGGPHLKEENNYIFNLKFFNLYNNKQMKNIKKKSNTVINQYSSCEDKYYKNIEINKFNIVNPKVITPKKNIIKKRVVFEEEYMIDSNGNQKFLCVKRILDNDNISEENTLYSQDINKKRAFTSNNLLNSSKNRNLKKKIDYNFKNASRKIITINENLNTIKNNKKKLEAKTVFFSPQISYENIFSQNNDLTRSLANISNSKNSKKNAPINNNNIKIEKNILANSKSCIFKYEQNIKFHNIDNLSKINKFKNPITKIFNIKVNNEKNKNNKINYEKNLITRKQIRKKYGLEKAPTINNSRNYNENNFINDYNIKEKNRNNDTNYNKTNIKKNIYKTANLENNKIFVSQQNFSNQSESNNYKYHEIKSISKDKSNNNDIYSNKSQNNNFYYESKNKNHKIFPSTSMDNIKIIKSKSFKNDNIYKFQIKNRLEKHNNNQVIHLFKQNNPLCFSQQIQKY